MPNPVGYNIMPQGTRWGPGGPFAQPMGGMARPPAPGSTTFGPGGTAGGATGMFFPGGVSSGGLGAGTPFNNAPSYNSFGPQSPAYNAWVNQMMQRSGSPDTLAGGGGSSMVMTGKPGVLASGQRPPAAQPLTRPGFGSYGGGGGGPMLSWQQMLNPQYGYVGGAGGNV